MRYFHGTQLMGKRCKTDHGEDVFYFEKDFVKSYTYKQLSWMLNGSTASTVFTDAITIDNGTAVLDHEVSYSEFANMLSYAKINFYVEECIEISEINPLDITFEL